MKKTTLITAAIFAYCILHTAYCFSQGTAINSTGAKADSSAMLDVSGNKGLLIPRMSTAVRNNITSPAEGLMLFNTTTKCFESYVNNAWNIVSCPAACVPPVAPPANSATNTGCDSFTANWTAVTGATSYFLDVASDAGFTTFEPGYNNINVGNVLQYDISALTPGTNYYYRLRATNASCISSNSGTIMVTTSSAPASPTANTNTPSSDQIIWNWNSVSGATGYKWNTINNYSGSTDNGISTTYTQQGLNINTRYTFYVWSYNSCGNSPSPLVMSDSTFFTCGGAVSHGSVSGITPEATGWDRTYNTVQAHSSWGGKCWLKKNLGATAEATAANDGDAGRAGWHWQPNRLQGYYHDGASRIPNSAWISSINENSDWLPANDPCVQLLGNGWRIPTGSEWDAFRVASAANGGGDGGGYLSKGFNSYLKLHAAGALNETTGNLQWRTNSAEFWASDQYDNTTQWMHANNDTGCCNNIFNTDKRRGVTLRCIKD